MKLGVIGLGHMGYAITKGITKNNFIDPYDIYVLEHNDKTKNICLREGYVLTENIVDVCKTDVLMLAVRPNQLDEVLAKLKGMPIKCILSVVTGYSSAYIKEHLDNVPVVRCMPNTPLMVNYGATALSKTDDVSQKVYRFCKEMFLACGEVAEVSEDFLSNLVAVSGSVPAYIYYFEKCLVEDAVKNGLDYETARKLANQTVLGSAQMVLEYPDKDLETFVNEVATKGGATEQAINVFKERKLDEIISEANEKCIKKAKELGK